MLPAAILRAASAAFWATLIGIAAALFRVSLAASRPCLTIDPARLRVTSVLLSCRALLASSENCWVRAPHHCIGSITPGGLAGAAGSAGAAAAGAGAGAAKKGLGAGGGAGGGWSGAAAGMRIFSDSVRSAIDTFMVLSVDKVMRCTSSAWIDTPSSRAFCSSQYCTVRNSLMRFSSSAGSSVGAIHWPTPGRAAPAFLTRPCRKSKPGTILAKALVGSFMVAPRVVRDGRMVAPQACVQARRPARRLGWIRAG